MASDIFAVSFSNPIAQTTVDGVLESVLSTVLGIVATLAVLMIVVGGILYITSAGDPGRIQLAKSAITAAIIGLAIAIAAPTFLQEIYGVLGGDSGSDRVTGAKSLSAILLETLNVLLGVVGTLSVLMIVVGGIMYITAGGSDRADMAKKIVIGAIVGLAIAALALVIVNAVAGLV